MRSAHAAGVAPALTESSTELDTSNYVMVRESTDRTPMLVIGNNVCNGHLSCPRRL